MACPKAECDCKLSLDSLRNPKAHLQACLLLC